VIELRIQVGSLGYPPFLFYSILKGSESYPLKMIEDVD
jgi:hypothetical protein